MIYFNKKISFSIIAGILVVTVIVFLMLCLELREKDIKQHRKVEVGFNGRFKSTARGFDNLDNLTVEEIWNVEKTSKSSNFLYIPYKSKDYLNKEILNLFQLFYQADGTNLSIIIEKLNSELKTMEDIFYAIELWDKIVAPENRKNCLMIILNKWAKISPPQAVAWIMANITNSITVAVNKQYLLADALYQWSKVDSREAVEWAIMNSNNVPFYIVERMMDVWASTDSVQSLNWVIENSYISSENKRNLISRILIQMAYQSPEKVIDILKSFNDPLLERMCMSNIAVELGKKNPLYAVKLAKQYQEEEYIKNMLIQSAISGLNVASHNDIYAFISEIPKEIKDYALYVLVSQVAYKNPQLALELTAHIEDINYKENAERTALMGLADNDPVAAFNFIRSLPRDHSLRNIEGIILQKWMQKKPEEKDKIMEYVSETYKPLLHKIEIFRWIESDPLDVFLYFQTNPGEDSDYSFRMNAIQKLAYSDPERAVECALVLPDNKVKINALFYVFNLMANTAPDKTIQSIDKLLDCGMDLDSIIRNVSLRLAKKDPEKASLLALKINDIKMRESTFGAITEIWAEVAPEKLESFIESINIMDNKCIDRAKANIAVAFAPADLNKSIAIIETIEDNTVKSSAARAVADLWAKINPRASLDWLYERRTVIEHFSDVMKSILEQWAWNWPDGYEKSAEWIISKGADQPLDVLIVMIERLARYNSDMALSFAMLLPEDDKGQVARGKAFEMLIRETARRDGKKAAQIWENCKIQFDRVVVAEVIFNWASQSPQEAAEWVAQKLLPGSPERQQAVSDIYYQWSKKDPVSAERWYKQMINLSSQ